MKNLMLFSMAAVVMLSASCKKNTADNTPKTTQAQVNYQLKTSNSSNSVAQKTTAGSLMVWTSGFAYPSMVKLTAKQNGTSIEYKSTNTQQIDLMTSSNIYFGNFSLPSGAYNEVELKLMFNKNGSYPAIQLNGMFSTPLLTVPVVVIIDEYQELKTEAHDVIITDDASFTAVTELDLSVITLDITEAMLLNADLTDGKIVISNHSNHNIYVRVTDNFGKKKHKCHFDKH